MHKNIKQKYCNLKCKVLKFNYGEKHSYTLQIKLSSSNKGEKCNEG